jgi:hypothetical protein
MVLAPMPIALDAENLIARGAGIVLLAVLLLYGLRARTPQPQ